MPTKSTKTPLKDPRSAVIAAALALAARRDWGRVTLSDIARTAKVPLADISTMFDGKEDIIAAYSRVVDHDVLRAYPDGVPGAEEKDRLFDILMERFDLMHNDRDALVSIIKSVCADPKQMVIGLPGVARSMTWMLEACGAETEGWRGAARVATLSGVYLWVLRTWVQDDSQDMAKTMAALDRGLDRCASFAEVLGI